MLSRDRRQDRPASAGTISTSGPRGSTSPAAVGGAPSGSWRRADVPSRPAPPAHQVEVLSGGRAVDDADIVLGGLLQEPLQAGARVLGAAALIAVRQEQRQAGRLTPFRTSGDDELIDDDLCAVDEVPELRLPEDERVGRRDRVAVLEGERRELRKRRVVDLERSGCRPSCWSRVDVSPVRGSWRTAWRCENVPRSVSWPDRRIDSSSSKDANASASRAPSRSRLPASPRRRSSWRRASGSPRIPPARAGAAR